MQLFYVLLVKTDDELGAGMSMRRGDTVNIDAYFRATNYLAVAQLYLRENVLLEKSLLPQHVKDPVLGHWGTVPGVNFVYTHANRLARDHDVRVLIVVGAGHAAAAVLANSYLDGTLERFYPELTRDRTGIAAFVRRFGQPDAFPTELSPAIPCCIHPGGELGHALSVAFGTALDQPGLVTICIIGDGEAETGPTAAAWHGVRFLNRARSGAVLPILHLNGYKMGSPSLYADMADRSLVMMFGGLGYAPRIVSADHREMHQAMEWAIGRLRAIQMTPHQAAGNSLAKWPMLIVRTLKGWTGPKSFDGRGIEGTHRAHKAPIPNPIHNEGALEAVERWLRSYRPEELFDADGRPSKEVLACLPESSRRLGMTSRAIFEHTYRELEIPSLERLVVEARTAGDVKTKPAEHMGRFLREVTQLNATTANFRVFSPDELESNQLGSLLEITRRTAHRRADELGEGDPEGRVIEVLSEHLCQGWLQGYLATGGHGILASYECFIPVVASMISQYIKYLQELKHGALKEEPSSLNYFLTSLGWHNNYSHQNPDLYSILSSKHAPFIRIYFPPDANSLLACARESFRSRGRINVLVAAKTPLPVWTSLAQASELALSGVVAWNWATRGAEAPALVLAASGDYATVECLHAAELLQEHVPDLAVRFVSVCELTSIGSHDQFPHAIDDPTFSKIFTEAMPVVFLFGGYPAAVKALLFSRPHPDRFTVLGYRDRGTTTTLLDTEIRNEASRYDVVAAAAAALHRRALITPVQSGRLRGVAEAGLAQGQRRGDEFSKRRQC